jgi:apolipoprotein N-acyltransferase
MTRRKRKGGGARAHAPRDPMRAPIAVAAAASAARIPRSLEWALAGVSGVLIAAACSLFPLGWLAWIALLPLLWVIDHAESTSRAILMSWWAGAVASFGTLLWMIPLIARFTDAPLLAALLGHLLFSAYQGLVLLLFGWIVRVGRERYALPMSVIAPAALVAGQASIWFLFPYGIEISQAFYPPLIQIADVLGRYGVAALLALANAAAYDLLFRRGARSGFARRCAIGGWLLLGAALLYGQVRLRTYATRIAAAPQLRIGIVQPNADVELPGTEQGSAAEQAGARARRLAGLRSASAQLAARGAQLIVWSEVSYPGLYSQLRRADFADGDPQAISSGIQAPLVAGSLTQDGGGRQYNSALVIAPGGSIVGRYDKNVLVPFGEYIPAAVNYEWVRRLALGTGPGLLPGAEIHPIGVPSATLGGVVRAGMLICYEDVLPDLTRRIGTQQPQLLINLSNDAWFDSPIESRQHLAMAVYAAVEERTSLARAVNPGISAIVDPSGRVSAESRFVRVKGRSAAPDTLLASVSLLTGGVSVFATAGHWFPQLCQLASLALLLGARFRTRPSSRQAGAA